MIKNYYESYIIIDGDTEDAAVEELISKYDALLRKNEVEIRNIDRVGRRKLAYPIRKKQNGYYVCFEITASPSLIARLERTYRLDESIIRFLTISMDEQSLKDKEDYLKKKALYIARIEAETAAKNAQNEQAETAADDTQKDSSNTGAAPKMTNDAAGNETMTETTTTEASTQESKS